MSALPRVNTINAGSWTSFRWSLMNGFPRQEASLLGHVVKSCVPTSYCQGYAQKNQERPAVACVGRHVNISDLSWTAPDGSRFFCCSTSHPTRHSQCGDASCTPYRWSRLVVPKTLLTA